MTPAHRHQPDETTVSVERGELRLAGLIDPHGTAANPGEPAIRITAGADVADDALFQHLIKDLIDRAREQGIDRLRIAWDTMDREGIRLLEQLDFRPETPPYFELGGGEVEYVSGYTDPSGSQLELVRNLI